MRELWKEEWLEFLEGGMVIRYMKGLEKVKEEEYLSGFRGMG